MDDFGPLDIPLEYSSASTVQTVPKEVLAVLPTDPYEQLKLAHKISSRAYTQKVSSLESEVGHLRRALADKNGHIRTLETSLTSCQLDLQEANEKVRASNDAQSKLAAEKSALVGTVRGLNRQIAKLEGFKRNLLTSLQASEEMAEEPPVAGIAAADLAGEALVQEALQQEQLHSSPLRAPSPYRGATGGVPNGLTDRSTTDVQLGTYMQVNGGPTPARSHGGSGGTSPAAGYSLRADQPGGYEPAGRPMDKRATSGGYGSPLDLPRTDHSNASELSTGYEGEGRHGYGSHHNTTADPQLANGYGPADGHTPAPLGRYTPTSETYGSDGREPINQAQFAPPQAYSHHNQPHTAPPLYSGRPEPKQARGATSPMYSHREPDLTRAAQPSDYGRREPVTAHEPLQQRFDGGFAPDGRLPDRTKPSQDGGLRDSLGAAPAHAAGQRQATPLDGKEFFRRARARLATEPFARFLAAIKELNAGQRSRADTLRLAREVFGARDADLYSAFEGLLNRHLPAM
ncbi:g3686 [Coccomyxa elongata]